MIIEINPEFGAIVAANDGYCPCAIERTEDTRCMCKLRDAAPWADPKKVKRVYGKELQ